MQFEDAGDQMPMLNIEAGAYSGQGHTFATSFLLQANGTRCSNTKIVETQNLSVQIPFDKYKFKADPALIGNLTCYASTQN